jgi:hypothetical protein
MWNIVGIILTSENKGIKPVPSLSSTNPTLTVSRTIPELGGKS